VNIGTYTLLVSRPEGPMGWWKTVMIVSITVAVLWWAAEGSNLSANELMKGAPWVWDFLTRMLPPNWAFAENLLVPALETIQIAIWGTLLAILMAVPVCFFAARNLTPNMFIFHSTRQIFNAARGINEIILALIFVAAVGLGPFAGVIALAIHGAGMLGKFFAEAIEEIDQGPIEALRSTGAGQIQVIIFGVIPQVITAWIAVCLYRFETNLRQATVLGMVGAGGIGFELVGSMKLFQYKDTATCIAVILVMVMTADYVSSRLRAWIQEGERT